jgi:hypothetical protein
VLYIAGTGDTSLNERGTRWRFRRTLAINVIDGTFLLYQLLRIIN